MYAIRSYYVYSPRDETTSSSTGQAPSFTHSAEASITTESNAIEVTTLPRLARYHAAVVDDVAQLLDEGVVRLPGEEAAVERGFREGGDDVVLDAAAQGGA